MSKEKLFWKDKARMWWVQHNPRSKRPQLAESTFEWKKLGPMDFFTSGAPDTMLHKIILMIAGMFCIAVTVVQDACIKGNYVMDLELLDNLLLWRFWIGLGLSFLLMYDVILFQTSTFSKFECQIEPCMIRDYATGDIHTTALRVLSAREIWPPEGLIGDIITERTEHAEPSELGERGIVKSDEIKEEKTK